MRYFITKADFEMLTKGNVFGELVEIHTEDTVDELDDCEVVEFVLGKEYVVKVAGYTLEPIKKRGRPKKV